MNAITDRPLTLLMPIVLLLALTAGSCAHGRIASSPLLNPRDPAMNQRAPEVFRARFETSRGTFVVEVHRSWAPIGADRFYNLVAHGFFDGQRFFRVRAGSFVQFGIPGDPRIAHVWRNATIADDPQRESNLRGTIAYAFVKPRTRATQVFINLADHRSFDAEGFAPFGKVIEGMAVVDGIYAGYGESAGGGMRAGHQNRLFAEGNVWLRRDFPRLDWIERATIMSPSTSSSSPSE